MSIVSYPLVVRSGLGLTLAIAVAWTIGCRSEAQPTVPAARAGGAMTGGHGQPKEEMNMANNGGAAGAKTPAGLDSLSPEDRELALRQKVCPVSGEELGSMGPPIKVTVAGHDVFICCPGCKEPLEKEPAKYLAKLGIQGGTM
jgi:hypothetical protein